VFKRYDTIRARIWNGAVISGIEFEWEPDSNGMHGRFALTLVHDLDRIVDAIAGLLQDAQAGTFGGFGYGAIRGVALMDALFDKLGIEYPAVSPSLQVTPAAVDPSGAAGGAYEHSENPPVGLFQRHCGACHGSATRSPPGFLAGDGEQVVANLRACAERIGFRLTMWRTPADARARSPMPPAAHLGAASIDITEWLDSDDYAALHGYADALRSSGNEPPSSKDYADLPPCLPQAFGN
jgi:mono/diheme cytochrome c family protein